MAGNRVCSGERVQSVRKVSCLPTGKPRLALFPAWLAPRCRQRFRAEKATLPHLARQRGLPAPARRPGKREFRRGNRLRCATFWRKWGSRRYGNHGPQRSRLGCRPGPSARHGRRPEHGRSGGTGPHQRRGDYAPRGRGGRGQLYVPGAKIPPADDSFPLPDGEQPGHCRRTGTGSVFTRLSCQGSYRAEARFTTWLYRIATNLAVNYARDTKNERTAQTVYLDQPDPETGTSPDLADDELGGRAAAAR